LGLLAACHGPGNAMSTPGWRSATTQRSPMRERCEARSSIRKRLSPCGPRKSAFLSFDEMVDRSEDWRVRGFRYRRRRSGSHDSDYPSVAGAANSGLALIWPESELLRDFFWPDGMVRVSGRDYNGLLESPCYRAANSPVYPVTHSTKAIRTPVGRQPDRQPGLHPVSRRFARNRSDCPHASLGASSGNQCTTATCRTRRTACSRRSKPSGEQSEVADELATGRPNAATCHLDKRSHGPPTSSPLVPNRSLTSPKTKPKSRRGFDWRWRDAGSAY